MIVIELLGALVVVIILIGVISDAVSRKRDRSVSAGQQWSSEYERKQYAADLEAERHEPPKSWNHGIDPPLPPPPAER
jgi:hypothetical protein